MELAVSLFEQFRGDLMQSPIAGLECSQVMVDVCTAEINSVIHTPSVIINQVDQALYRSKQLGRNCVSVYSPESIGDTNSEQALSIGFDDIAK